MKIRAIRQQKHHVSPLRYPGGKTFLFPVFARLMRDAGMKNVTYVEPYAGGAGAALALLLSDRVDRIILNDLDGLVYAFWRSVISYPNIFIDKILTTSVTVEEWKRQRNICADTQAKILDRGFATFFLNRTNVSGNLDGGPIGGLDQKGKWGIAARFYRETLAERVRKISQMKDRIAVTNEDGVNLIGRHVKKKRTFIYADPPYFDKGATLYLNHYDKQDHEHLASLLNKNANAHWSVTYDNKKEIRSLYSNREIISFSLNYNAYEPRKGREIMILSDALRS